MIGLLICIYLKTIHWCGGWHCHLIARRFLLRILQYVCSLHVFPISAWVLSRYFGTLPQTNDCGLLTGNWCECECEFLPLCLYVRCDELPIYPGCTPPLVQCQLGSAPALSKIE